MSLRGPQSDATIRSPRRLHRGSVGGARGHQQERGPADAAGHYARSDHTR